MQKDWKEFETNNKWITLSVLFISQKTKEIKQAYISKYNLEHANMLILLMIANSEKWHYLNAKQLLVQVITRNWIELQYWQLLHELLYSFRTESYLKVNENAWNNHDYFNMEMLEEDNKILKHNQDKKSRKTPFVIHADTDFLLENIHDNDPDEPSTTKNKQIYSVWLFKLFIW